MITTAPESYIGREMRTLAGVCDWLESFSPGIVTRVEIVGNRIDVCVLDEEEWDAALALCGAKLSVKSRSGDKVLAVAELFCGARLTGDWVAEGRWRAADEWVSRFPSGTVVDAPLINKINSIARAAQERHVAKYPLTFEVRATPAQVADWESIGIRMVKTAVREVQLVEAMTINGVEVVDVEPTAEDIAEVEALLRDALRDEPNTYEGPMIVMPPPSYVTYDKYVTIDFQDPTSKVAIGVLEAHTEGVVEQCNKHCDKGSRCYLTAGHEPVEVHDTEHGCRFMSAPAPALPTIVYYDDIVRRNTPLDRQVL